jgi:hypothetical protein
MRPPAAYPVPCPDGASRVEERDVYAFSATIEPGVNNANNVTFGYDVAAMPRYNDDGTFARDADGNLLPMDTGLPSAGGLW